MPTFSIHDTFLLPGFLDIDNPRSMLNISPPELRKYILDINPKIFTYSDSKLNKEAKPDLTAKCLRINFWIEYVKAQDSGKEMQLGNILKGVTTKQYFVHLAETNPIQLAWIITPPKDYNIVQQQIFMDGLDKLRHLLRLEPYDIIEKTTYSDKGETKTVTRKLNPGYVAEVRKIVESLSDRLQGSIEKKVNVSGQLQHSIGPSPTSHYDIQDVLALEAIDSIEGETK